MTRVQDIFEYLCELAPLELQLEFDNSGFLLGHAGREVKRVLLALDITDKVVDEALEKDVQLIVSHHPLIFHPLRSLTDRGEGALVLRMAEEGLAAVCMHTNLDIAPGGVNDVLFAALGGEEGTALDADGCGRCGVLKEPVPLESFLRRCRDVLRCRGLRYYDAGRPVHRLAVMGGAGAEAIRAAAAKGCDTYVTADVKYHQFQEAAACGLNVIDADHFCTENPIIPVLAERLRLRFPEVDFMPAGSSRQFIDCL